MALDKIANNRNNPAQWSCVPLISVGPLRFGMAGSEVAAALGEPRSDVQSGGSDSSGRCFRLRWAEFYEVGITVYYDEAEILSCIAVDAFRGPQVTLDGIPLVGQVPSELALQFIGYTSSHGAQAVYSQHGDPGADELGIVLRAQRVGDVVLTRPVFVARAWADRVSDVTEGSIPEGKWSQL